MASENFYDILDEKVPGGILENLDREVILDRKLYLTRISMDKLEDMFEYSQDERLYRCFEYSPHQKLEDTRKYLQKLLDGVGVEKVGRKSMYWFIRLLDSGKAIGTIGLLEIDTYRESATWGYAIDPSHWGRGLILEAQMLVIKYFFEDLKLNRLYGVTAIDNDAVLSSVSSAGCQREGILRDFYKYAGNIRKDAVIYSLLAKDYFSKNCEQITNAKCLLSLETLKKIGAFVFDFPGLKMDENTTMSDIPQWDSLNHIAFIMAIEKETGIKFKPTEIARATTVKDLLAIVNGEKG